MKTKIFTLFFALITCEGIMLADQVQIGELYYNLNITNLTAEVAKLPSSSYVNYHPESITIPSSVTYDSITYAVKSIGNRAFENCSFLKSVIMSDNITSIGSYVFSSCTGLANVTIPSNVVSIGEYAFYDCSGLTSVTIGNSVTSIGECAFYDCSSLTTPVYNSHVFAYMPTSYSGAYTIPDSIESIAGGAFEGCTSLTSVTIPNSVKNIGSSAFGNCTGLTSVHINDLSSWCNIDFDNTKSNPLYYAHHLYVNEEEIVDLVIPSSITSIGNCAFSGCTGLASVTIPSSITNIGEYAFSGCTGLANVTIPSSVVSIGSHAFAGCTGLTSITIPNSVTSIEDLTFYGCFELASVIIPNSVARIGDEAFKKSGLKVLYIPNSVTSIGVGAFSGCLDLTSITIPDSLTSIGELAFYDCKKLTSITVPNSVISIGEYAFSGCNGLTSINIPNSVTSIGNGAFNGCGSLKSVHINDLRAWCGIDFSYYTSNPLAYAHHLYVDSVEVTNLVIPNIKNIKNHVFDGGSSLKSVRIPHSVTSLGKSAFYGCTGLTSITCESANPPICDNTAFTNVSKAIPLYVLQESMDEYAAADVWKEFNNILPIQAEEVETPEITIEATDNSAEVSWPQTSGAYTYELIIRDAQGNIVCVLIFNAQGQLQRITFNALSRENISEQVQSDGFAFTINNLNSGTTYNYTLTAKDANGSILNSESGTFSTQGAPQAIDEINANANAVKIFRNGQLLILRGDKTYTLTGQELR